MRITVGLSVLAKRMLAKTNYTITKNSPEYLVITGIGKGIDFPKKIMTEITIQDWNVQTNGRSSSEIAEIKIANKLEQYYRYIFFNRIEILVEQGMTLTEAIDRTLEHYHIDEDEWRHETVRRAFDSRSSIGKLIEQATIYTSRPLTITEAKHFAKYYAKNCANRTREQVQRESAVLAYLLVIHSDQTVEQAANITGQSERTIKKNIVRSFQKIKRDPACAKIMSEIRKKTEYETATIT